VGVGRSTSAGAAGGSSMVYQPATDGRRVLMI
jgi:hypothetical protein